MKRYYVNLLGTWVDITDAGTVEDHQRPAVYFAENLTFEDGDSVAKCFRGGYLNVQYEGKNYRIHPAQVQIVTEP